MARLEDEIRQKEFKNEYQKLILNLIYTGNWINNIHKKFFSQFGLSNEQYNVLRILRGQHPAPSTIQLVNERMLDKMSNVSRLVEKLRLKGLVLRKPAKHDRRQVDVLISKKGLELLKKIDLEIQNLDQNIANISKKEAREVNIILDKLRD